MTSPEDSERLATAEARLTALAGIPERVAAVEARLEGIQTNIFREVDGLRAQQQSHKDELKRDIAGVTTAVNDLRDLAASGKGSLRTLTFVGMAIGGMIAALAALKSLLAGYLPTAGH